MKKMRTTEQAPPLRWREHPLVKEIEEKQAQALADSRKLTRAAKALESELDKIKLQLGRAEAGVEVGKGADPAKLRKQIRDLEMQAQQAREESERRLAVAQALKEELPKVIRSVIREIEQYAQPLIVAKTSEYVDLMRRAYQLSQEITDVYEGIAHGGESLYHKHRIHKAQPPHDSIVLNVMRDWSAMNTFFEESAKLGY